MFAKNIGIYSLKKSVLYMLFKISFFFNWNIIALQSCVSLQCYCTLMWIRHMYAYICFLWSLPPPPSLSLVITDHQDELPVLTSSFPLAICLHIVVYICQPQTPNLPQSLLSPLPCSCVCDLCLCLYSWPANRFIFVYFTDILLE